MERVSGKATTGTSGPDIESDLVPHPAANVLHRPWGWGQNSGYAHSYGALPMTIRTCPLQGSPKPEDYVPTLIFGSVCAFKWVMCKEEQLASSASSEWLMASSKGF